MRVLLAVSIVGATLGACSGAPKADPDDRPNILLVSIDSLRADHLGSDGYSEATSPALDALADHGVRFSQAISTTSWTLPAHSALFTGLPDSAHGVTTPHARLPREIPTLAGRLTDAGYETVGFFSGPFLHPFFGLDRGFGRYVDCRPLEDRLEEGSRDATDATGERPVVPESHDDVTNPIVLWNVMHEARELGDRPFFVFLHLWDVHYDLLPPPPYDTLFDPTYEGEFDGSRFHQKDGHVGATERDLENVLALYDGEIRYTDDTLRLLFDHFEARGLLENTWVVVTADHGEEYFDHGGKGHRSTLFQEVLRVPLLFWHGGGGLEHHGALPRTVETPVSLIDVAPTLLDLAGLEPLPDAFGRSLVPALEGRALRPRPLLAELTAPPLVPDLAAVILGHEKLLVDHATGRSRYYDLRTDPGEKAPIPSDESPRAAELRRMLDDLRTASRARRQAFGAASSTEPLDPAIEARLRALGYLD